MKDNFGYDLPAVEAAMKKHEAIEADISSYQERIQVVVELALEMESEGYYDTKRISAQKDNILRQWGLLTELVRARRARLEQNLALQKIFQEMVYMIDWMEEMQVLLVSKDLGKHLLEVEDLLQKHGLLEADISAQTERVQALNAAALKFSELEGYQPCDPQIICNRVNHVQTCLEELEELAAKRRKELEDSRQLWTFFQEMEEAEAWIREKEKILAAKTCGRDLSSVLTLTTKHKTMLGELGNRRALLHQTMKKGEKILAKKSFGPAGIQEKMREVCLRWKKLEEVTGLHQQRLEDALNFFQFSAETDDLVAWLQDAYRIVSSDDFGHDDYSTQVTPVLCPKQARRNCSETELESSSSGMASGWLLVASIPPLSPPPSWNRVVELVETKKGQLSSALKIQNFLLECGEMKAQVREKRKAIEATQSGGGGDLGGVLALQRRLSTMEAALVVLEPRLLELQREGEALAAAHPARALEILLPFEEISDEWENLKRALQGCEDTLTVAGRLQQFIQDLDDFLGWLVKTQAAVGSEEVPDSLAEAERLLNVHVALKEEINGYEEDYAKIQAASELLALEEMEVPSLSLQQWLQKLDAGWGKLLQSWEMRRELLVQSHVFHLFLRDVQQCQNTLYNQVGRWGGREEVLGGGDDG
ncbi:PREDICTED: spectrin beta chain, non-erythrocytic 4-like [Lepidothrix coronata]|uniref:Spectrin beta chain, non-erythrocytic 4-like n=1 Tax=Lepidothrix coronata TaxID=321398 RepID=A0A6J0J8Z2_9PASS|nr:PREDICTED: spectrin beta chain, non-erythrocytic 4-like [Lepidothrix coronata]